MFWSKIKIATAVALFVAVAGSGVGLVSYRTLASGAEGQPDPMTQQSTPSHSAKKVQAPPADDELRAAQNDLVARENDLKEAESNFERAKARLQVGKLRVAELQKKLPAKPRFDPKEPVAFIFDLPITRQELADYLIAQYGADKIEQLVNKLIIERACLEKGITVSDAEIDAAIKEDMKAMWFKEPDAFEKDLKNRFHRSLSEWREDVIKPRLCMTKLARMRVSVSEEDLRRAFEGAYGEKVQCDIILWPKGQEQAAKEACAILSDRPNEFEEIARKQPNGSLAARLGRLEPFGRHTTEEEDFEIKAFGLKPGESSIVETKQGTMIIKCIRRIPPEKVVKLEEVRAQLTEQVLNQKAQQEIPKLFEELKKQANPRLLLKK